MTQKRVSRRVTRFKNAASKFDISISSLWDRSANDPEFPKPFKIGPRTTVFFEDELDDYLEACARERVLASHALAETPVNGESLDRVADSDSHE